MPYMQVHRYMSTETAYFDDDGNEVGRHENHDDYWWDSDPKEYISQEELEDNI